MAIIHRATLAPTKVELVTAWLPTQAWSGGAPASVRPVAAYRFDDPAGEVGIESHLLDVDGELLHVPLTYRGAPLAGADEWLLGTTEHSVLGTRWVYDGPGDPVYRDELTRVVREGGTQVPLFLEAPQGPVELEPSMRVRGSGAGAGSQVVVVRRPAAGAEPPSDAVLAGTWPGQEEPVVLAYLA